MSDLPRPPRARIRYTERSGTEAGRYASLRSAVTSRVAGADWRPRAVLLPVLAWLFWKHLVDPDYHGIVSGLNLALHEAGHMALVWPQMWFGWDLLMVAGGTLFEVGIPAAVAVYFWRQRDPFGATVALFWMGTAMLDVAPYAADARAQLLPLVSVGGGPVGHDWYIMLEAWGLLDQDQRIGVLFRGAGLLCLAGSIVAGILVLRWMAGAPAAEKPPEAVNHGERKTATDPGGTDRRFRETFQVPEEGLEPPTRGL